MLARWLIAAVAAVAVLGFTFASADSRPSEASGPPAVTGDLGPVPMNVPALRRTVSRSGVDVYRGVGAWVDMYDPAELGNPWPALVEMRDRGVRTLYFETASWRVKPKSVDFKDPQAVELFLDEAHALGLKVVAWYLPGLDDMRTDLRRTRAVLEYSTPNGQRFDGLAIDIESQNVRALRARNAALVRYSRAVRRYAGPSYALGAIIPDLRSTTVTPGLWPGFPYRTAARYYDVFLPMAYSSYRAHGASYVYAYSRANVRYVRAWTGRPVHLIGGLTDALASGEAAAMVRGARDGGAIGASFYDFAIGQDEAWRALTLLGR